MSEADYNKLTIAQLKEELDNRGLDKTGRKADLVSRLVEHDKASGTEAVEDEEEITEEAEAEAAVEEETAGEAQSEQAEEDMVTLDQVGEGEDAAQPDAATEEELLKEDGTQGEEGDAAPAEGEEAADTSATEAGVKDADMKDMIVLDEFDALGNEIEVEMARLIDEQIEAARERTKQEEAERERKAKEEAEKKAAEEEAKAKAKAEQAENGEGDGEEKKDDEEGEKEEKPEEEKTEEEKKAEQEKKEQEEKERKEKEKRQRAPRMNYAKPPKMTDAKLELACDMVKNTVQVQPISLEQLSTDVIKTYLDKATSYRFMRGWNSEKGHCGRLQMTFSDPAMLDEVIKTIEENQETLGEECKGRSFTGIKTVDIRHTFMRQVVPCTDSDIGQMSLLLRRMPISVTTEKLRAVFQDSTYIMLNREER